MTQLPRLCGRTGRELETRLRRLHRQLKKDMVAVEDLEIDADLYMEYLGQWIDQVDGIAPAGNAHSGAVSSVPAGGVPSVSTGGVPSGGVPSGDVTSGVVPSGGVFPIPSSTVPIPSGGTTVREQYKEESGGDSSSDISSSSEEESDSE